MPAARVGQQIRAANFIDIEVQSGIQIGAPAPHVHQMDDSPDHNRVLYRAFDHVDGYRDAFGEAVRTISVRTFNTAARKAAQQNIEKGIDFSAQNDHATAAECSATGLPAVQRDRSRSWGSDLLRSEILLSQTPRPPEVSCYGLANPGAYPCWALVPLAAFALPQIAWRTLKPAVDVILEDEKGVEHHVQLDPDVTEGTNVTSGSRLKVRCEATPAPFDPNRYICGIQLPDDRAFGATLSVDGKTVDSPHFR